ncbi:nematocyst expressed protein 4-like [Haliotis rubra]|uniref:nematocyst expressed protein 4-like n=1 Tax=Haliotis rubra TaxID=36100 RepID=UPI001EE62C44|nr:nematocyst expressed protein 4-like [Haliotis rubra]
MLPKLAALYVAVQLFDSVCPQLLPIPTRIRTPYPASHSTPTPVTVELPEYRCRNVLPYDLCRFYSSGCRAKGAQMKWAVKYCPDFCQLCVRDDYCKDQSSACTDGSRFVGCSTSEWGYNNCHYSCGRCVRTVITCKDRISTCSGVSKEVCSSSFSSWAWNNCAKSCGLCNDTSILGSTPWLHATNTGCKQSHGSTPCFTGYTPYQIPHPGPSRYPIGNTPSPGATPYLGPTPWPIGFIPYPGATPYPGPSRYPIGYTPSPGATPYLGPTPWPIGYTPSPGATPYPGPSRYPIGYTPSPGATPYLGPTPWPIGFIPYPGATPYPGPSRYPIGYTPSPGATPYLGPTPWPIGYTPSPRATPYPGPSRYPIGYTPSPGATPYLGKPHIPSAMSLGQVQRLTQDQE